ncbi:MAG: hypothetical protein ACREQ8_04360 [Woeseiaceae bacterium]
MSSFMTFPGDAGADPLDYGGVCEGWCHCFREPGRFLPPERPRVLLSYSDFTDPTVIAKDRLGPDAVDSPRFDFIYVGANQSWKMETKNWSLANRCLSRLSGELGLRGLVIGVSADAIDAVRGLTFWRWLPYLRFLQVLARSRFLFVPNELDASPRILTEALCLDVPLLVHRPILGGWKYVQPATGVFFDREEEVTGAASHCLNGSFHPRSWYLAHHGPQRAGETLRLLIEELDPGFQAPGLLGLAYEFN